MSDSSSTSGAIEPFLLFMNHLPDNIDSDVRKEIEAAVRTQRELDEKNQKTRDEIGSKCLESDKHGRLRKEVQGTAATDLVAACQDEPAARRPNRPTVDSNTSMKGKAKVLMTSGRMKPPGLHFSLPSQKVRDQIRACDFIYLWHLTPAGLAAATRADNSGELEIEDNDKLHGFVTDVDLTHDEWMSALTQYIIFMKLEGVAEDIVKAMERVNKVMCEHPDRILHARAIRLWHQEHRLHWALSGNKNADGARDDLGLVSNEDFRECTRRVEDGLDDSPLGSSAIVCGTKRPASDDFARQTKVKAGRNAIRRLG